MQIDNVRLSSVLMSIGGAIMLYIINNPQVLQQLMGNYYLMYGGIAAAIILIIYNVVFAGQEQPKTE